MIADEKVFETTIYKTYDHEFLYKTVARSCL